MRFGGSVTAVVSRLTWRSASQAKQLAFVWRQLRQRGLALVGSLGLGHLALNAALVGGLVVAMVSTQLTILSYGTTARAARFHGAGDRGAAVRDTPGMERTRAAGKNL